MTLAAPRLPGLRFQTVRPPVPPGLPRMDVAAFVGFAGAGPVGVPVAVDDEVRFRQVFGADLPLAWDRARGETAYAHLGPAVREFFRNGGRRCWIVRIADEQAVEASVFRVPGMLAGAGDDVRAAWLAASSPGSWADGVSLNASLQSTVVPDAEETDDGVRTAVESPALLRLEWPEEGAVAFFPPRPDDPPADATREEREAWRVRPASAAYWFREMDPRGLAASPPEAAWMAGPREVPLGGAAWAVSKDGTALEIALSTDVPPLQAGCWLRAAMADGGVFAHDRDPFAPPPDPRPWAPLRPPTLAAPSLVGTGGGTGGGGSPPRADGFLLVDEVRRVGAKTCAVVRQAWRRVPARDAWDRLRGRAHQASLVSVELWARRGDGSVDRLPDLGLARRHPRYLGALPPDAALYAPAETLAEPLGTLAAELALRPFGLAAPGPSTAADGDDGGAFRTFLPLAVPAVPRDDLAQAAHSSGRSPLERDGLASFGAGMFLDPALAPLPAERLLDEAFHAAYVAVPPRPATRMHALLPVDEVSLLAVPDAVHTGWVLRDAEVPPPAPDAPALVTPLEQPDREGAMTVRWTAVPGAVAYTLQDAADPRFRSAVETTRTAPGVDGAGTRADLMRPRPCPDRLYLRVRARTDAGWSPWSETALLEQPDDAFDVCGRAPLHAPWLEVAEEGDRLEIRWGAAPGPAGPPPGTTVVYRVETSPEPGFGAPELVHEGTDTSAEVWQPTSGAVFFRAAARLEGTGDEDGCAPVVEESPWSAVRGWAARQDQRWETVEPAGSPPDAGAPDALDVHLAMLRFCAARADCFAVLALPRHLREAGALAHAQALGAALGGATEPGDAGARTLSFGALWHPWTVVRTPVAAAPLRAIPPDGATTGILAARAVDPGAWAAPANQPLAGVAALEPRLAESARAAFLGRRVNAVAPFPRGFMTWSEETLSDDPELRGIGVRRLLILLRRLVVRDGDTYVFQPNDPGFRRLVQRQFDALLGDLFVRGAFAGATHGDGYRVVTDETVNPPWSLEQGRLIVELRVAPSRPMAFLTVRLVQTGAGVTVQEG